MPTSKPPVPLEERIPWRTCLALVSEKSGVSEGELLGQSRRKRIAHARQELMALLYQATPLSNAGIGAKLGGRDHSTITHGRAAHAQRVAAGA